MEVDRNFKKLGCWQKVYEILYWQKVMKLGCWKKGYETWILTESLWNFDVDTNICSLSQYKNTDSTISISNQVQVVHFYAWLSSKMSMT